MLKNYVLLIQYDEEGRESSIKRFEFYSRTYAVKALEIATMLTDGHTCCAKLYRRRRAGGYRWVATRFRGGAHLSAWGE